MPAVLACEPIKLGTTKGKFREFMRDGDQPDVLNQMVKPFSPASYFV